MDENQYIKSLKAANRITEKGIREAIKHLNLEKESVVLDVPCGIGNHSIWLKNEILGSLVTGIDIDKEHIEYANKMIAGSSSSKKLSFEVGNINDLNFEDDYFDLVWCCDGLWLGTKESGCVNENPTAILTEMKRILKERGKAALLFWSGHKLLPGYPLLEAQLNDT